MKIQIFGQNELEEYIDKGGKVNSHLISITNPGKPLNFKHPSHKTPKRFYKEFDSVLELKFWDADKKENLHPKSNRKIIPSMRHINKVLRFIKGKDSLTIHCWRGVSRSSAIAYGILYYFLKDEKLAAKELIKIRREAMPLKLIAQLWDKKFGSNLSNLASNIYMARIEEMKKELDYDPDDYLEELEEV